MVALTLDRPDVDALLYALDDADEFFAGGPRADRMLATWQRLHHARCYRDGEAGMRGDATTHPYTLSNAEALDLWLLVRPEWLRSLRPAAIRDRVTAILNRCRPSTRLAAHA